jgi:uncharacterized surface protein with fasciclin (FAS1) repeats
MKNILETLRDSGSFATFISLVKGAGMEERLSSGGPYTVFAPSDDAFTAIDASKLEQIRRDSERLTEVVTYHIVPGVHSMVDLLGISRLRSLQGDDLIVAVVTDGVLLNNVPVVESDAWCTNGICHSIYSLLLPPLAEATAA